MYSDTLSIPTPKYVRLDKFHCTYKNANKRVISSITDLSKLGIKFSVNLCIYFTDQNLIFTSFFMFILFSIHDEKYRQIEYILKLQDSIKETSGLPELPIVVCWRQWTPLICNRADAAHRIHQTLYICCPPLAQGSNHMPFSSHPPYNQQENLTSINSPKKIIHENLLEFL